jgi:hypothetical protein
VPIVVDGRHEFENVVDAVANCSVPLDENVADENVWSYSCTGKGSAAVVTTSSPWLPMSFTPGMMVAVAVAIR